MADLNKESLEIWNALKPAIDQEIDSRTQGMVQRRKMKVTTAPSPSTNVIGVTEPFGTEILIPFVTNLISAVVGDYVWVEFMYGATNAFASAFASVDDKDYSVAGDLTVGGDATVNGIIDVVPRRCAATIPASSAGWKRILTYQAASANMAIGSNPFTVDITLFEQARQIRSIRLNGTYTNIFFDNEQSVTQNSSYNAFDGIRYTYDGNNQGHIDVHFALSSSRACTAYFDIKSRGLGYRADFVAVDFVSVADAPTGETIYSTYSFVENGAKFDTLLANTFNGVGIETAALSSGGSKSFTIPNGGKAVVFVSGGSVTVRSTIYANATSGGTVTATVTPDTATNISVSTAANTLTVTVSSYASHVLALIF